MSQKRKKLLALLISSFAPFFIYCSDRDILKNPPYNIYNKDNQHPSSPVNNNPSYSPVLTMNYQSTNIKEDLKQNETSQLIPIITNKASKKSRCQCPYTWKYTKKDEQELIDNNDGYAQGTKIPFRTLSGLGLTGLCLATATSFWWTTQNCSNDNLCYSSLGIKVALWASTATCAMVTFGPCCNEKAWANGEACNRCIRKREN